MTDEESRLAKERRKEHDILREELFRRQLSNSQILDRSVLSLSSAGLGLSSVFVSSLVPLAEARCRYLLYLSWGLFRLATISTLVSLFVSQKGIDKQFKLNRQYYLENKEEVINQKNLWAKATLYLSYVSAIAYIFAALFMVLFIALNIISTV